MCIGGGMLYTGGHDNAIFSWSLTDYEMVSCVEVKYTQTIYLCQGKELIGYISLVHPISFTSA